MMPTVSAVPGMIAAAAAVALACAPFPASAQFTAEEKFLVEVAASAVRVAPDVAALWPGFWAADQAFALHPVRAAALVVVPSPPAAAPGVRIPDPDLPYELRGRAFLHHAPLPVGNLFDTDFRFGDRVMTAVGRMDSIYSVRDPRLATLVYLFHESFHAHQERRFRPTSGSYRRFGALEEPPVDLQLISTPAFRASTVVERRMLAAALDVPEGEDPRPLLRDYLAVRAARIGALPPEYRDGEAHNERKEGSANIVGYEAGLLAARRSRSDLPAVLRADLLDPRLETDDFGRIYRSAHIYATGGAIGLLLDRLKADWRIRMESGATFVDLLAEAAGVDPVADSARVQAALERFGYREIMLSLPAAREPHPVAEFDQSGAFRLVLLGVWPRRVGMSGAPAIPVEKGLTVYTPETRFTFTAPRISLETSGRPVLLDTRMTARVVVMLDAAAKVQSAEGTSGVRTTIVSAEGMTVEIEGAVNVVRDGNSVVVTLP